MSLAMAAGHPSASGGEGKSTGSRNGLHGSGLVPGGSYSLPPLASARSPPAGYHPPAAFGGGAVVTPLADSLSDGFLHGEREGAAIHLARRGCAAALVGE